MLCTIGAMEATIRSALRAVRERGLDKVRVCAGCGDTFQLRNLNRYGAAWWCDGCFPDAFDGLW